MKVLWVDDKYETLEGIYESAEDCGIELIGFKSAEEVLLELEKPEKYDAVVLDGLFYLSSEEKGTPTKQTAFIKVASKLKALKEKGYILPWFILSGQISFTLDENSSVEGLADLDYANGKVFEKNKEEEDLWIELKKAVDQIPLYKLKQEYRQVLEVCTEKYIGVDAQKHLLKILSNIRNPNIEFDDELYFTQIRIILESMFRKANKIGFLHDKCINEKGEVNLTESSRFLSGLPTKHLNVNCEISHFPKLIADAVQSILLITGAASHTTDPEIKNNIDLLAYRKIVQSPYLLYSLTFRLMDVLIWFKEYADLNPNIENNKKSWINTASIIQSSDWITGTISQIQSNGYGTFTPDTSSQTLGILPNVMEQYSFKENDRVKITTKPNPRNEGGTPYIDLIEKI